MPENFPVPTGYLTEKAANIARTVERIVSRDGNATTDDLDFLRFNAEAIAMEAGRWLPEDEE